MVKKLISKHERRFLRFFEIVPGFVSWNLILFPYWGILIIPYITAYYVLFFDIYWFYQSFQIAATSFISHFRIQAAMKFDWLQDIKTFPDWKKVKHIVIIVTYREPEHTLERALDSLVAQDFPKNQLIPVLAQEDRAPIEHKIDKINRLYKKYKKFLPNLEVTLHKLTPGELIGKASNERYAAVVMKQKYIDNLKQNIDYFIVSSCDADHVYHPNHFACLTYKFLDNPKRHLMFWQAAILYYNNIWRIPAITRIQNTMGSIWNLSVLPRRDRLLNQANYSLSLKLLHESGYWDPDKIPEDWGIFFKAFYAKKGEVEVEPIYLPLYIDAAESTSFWKTLKNQYEQYKRWAWGVSDYPWIFRDFLIKPGVPFFSKTMRLIHVTWSHFMWPVNWFIITLGLTIPTFLNPTFGRTTIGFMLPKISSFILTLSLGFLVIMLIFDNIYKPKRPKDFPLWRAILMPLEFVLMPVAGFFFSALPGLDAHTRLMLGKYLEYRVTEKV